MVHLDHHCWYLGNQCVGAANLAPFLRFLAWLVLGVGYALAVAGVMGWRERRWVLWHTHRVWQVRAAAGCCSCCSWGAGALMPHWRHLPVPPSLARLPPNLSCATSALVPPCPSALQGGRQHALPLRLVTYSLRWVLSAPLWLALWGFAAALCSLTLVLVGLLLRRQLVLLARGQSYLDALQQQQLLPCGGAAAAAAACSSDGGGAGAPPAAGAAGHAASAVAGGLTGTPAATTCAGGTPRAVGRPPLGVPRAWWESAAGRSARRVFGDGHPAAWLLPRGAQTHDSRDKKHS